MKIGIVGTGKVGCACALAMATRGSARTLVLVDRTRRRAEAVATDIRYGLPLGPDLDVVDGDTDALAGCALVMITAGVNEKTGGATDRSDPKGRLRLLEKNATIYRDIVPKIARAAPHAVLLVVTDPPDPLADVARDCAPRARILSTGTFLDTLRFRVHLARRFGVDPRSVDAQVIGDHGTTQVFVWSGVRIAGAPLAALVATRGERLEDVREAIEQEVRYANITIIEGNEASQFGIGIVSARIAELVTRDTREVIPIGSFRQRYGVTLSLPSVVGREGVIEAVDPDLTAAESDALEISAATLQQALRQIAGKS